MAREQLSFTSCNLFNLNEPGKPIYKDRDGWSEAEYALKIAWMKQTLRVMKADVFGFQELWHGASLERCFAEAGLANDYTLLVPDNHAGQGIVCAGAVRTGLLDGSPRWITDFPPQFKLMSSGEDAQTAHISVDLKKFSRPVLHFVIAPGPGMPKVHVYVCHFKSKGPTRITAEAWYSAETYSRHGEAIGSAISTVRRTAEAMALRMILTDQMKGNDQPVVVLGDVNDGQHSNTLNILTGQPNFLLGLSRGGADTDLYTAQNLQELRSLRDVYYTHVFKNAMESLDHILVSQEFYDNSRKRIWAFAGMDVANDHLNRDDHKETGTTDHGVVRVTFEHFPASRD